MTPSFYHQSALASFTFWSIIYLLTRRPLHAITASSTITRPSWLPIGCILFLQSHRATFFYGQLVGLLLPCIVSDTLVIRCIAAISYTLYHITETSMTNRHGEYPILYIMWTHCIPNEQYAAAAAMGVTINFILSTGYAKISEDGLMDWLNPDTMRTYLECYAASKSAFARPLWPGFNRIVCTSNAALSIIAAMTLLLECIIVPATLFLPSLRMVACISMIGMHIGIALIMSLKVGVVFTTSLPAYVYGFCCYNENEIGSGPWILAAAIGLIPTIISILVGHSITPENWPFTPVSLFMWSYKDARALIDLFMVRDTRLVLASALIASQVTNKLIGMKVLHHVQVVGEDDKRSGCVHDAVLRTIGFTLIQGGQGVDVGLVKSLRNLRSSNDKDGPEMREFIRQTELWLISRRRLFEAHSGELLVAAYFVQVDDNMRVVKVLC